MVSRFNQYGSAGFLLHEDDEGLGPSNLKVVKREMVGYLTYLVIAFNRD